MFDYEELIACVNYCMANMMLLRYFDLGEVVKFIEYVNDFGHLQEELKIHNYFDGIEDVHMKSLKVYYLTLLKRIPQERWSDVYNAMLLKQIYKYELTYLGQQIRKTTSVGPSQSKPDNVFGKMNSLDSATVKDAHRGLLLTMRCIYVDKWSNYIYGTRCDENLVSFTSSLREFHRVYLRIS